MRPCRWMDRVVSEAQQSAELVIDSNRVTVSVIEGHQSCCFPSGGWRRGSGMALVRIRRGGSNRTIRNPLSLLSHLLVIGPNPLSPGGVSRTLAAAGPHPPPATADDKFSDCSLSRRRRFCWAVALLSAPTSTDMRTMAAAVTDPMM